MGDRRWIVLLWCVGRYHGLVPRIVDLLLKWFSLAVVRRFSKAARGLHGEPSWRREVRSSRFGNALVACIGLETVTDSPFVGFNGNASCSFSMSSFIRLATTKY
jgi:hypothetical protein